MENTSNDNSLKLKHSFTRDLLLFILGSALGIFTFFVPFRGSTLFQILYETLIIHPLGDNVKWAVLLIALYNCFALIYGRYAKEGTWFHKKYANAGIFKWGIYFLGLIFIVMALTKKGIPVIYHETTVNYMIREIFPFTIGCLVIGGLALPLLTKYGLLELIGTLLEPIMRPFLKLPGKAAVDTIASVVGAAVVGIFLTSELYHDNEYTEKEALSIASGFSLNSVGYCAFLVGYVGLSHMFNVMFLTYLIIAYMIGAIIVRIPPVSRHTNHYKDGSIQTDEMRKENSKFTMKNFKDGFDKAILKADSSDNIPKDLAGGLFGGLMVSVDIIPMMAVIGGLSLVVYNFTPIIQMASKPLIPLISLFKIPEAALAAEAIFLGGIELFMPSLVVSAGTNIEAVRYFVVMVSMVQVLYITETMLPIITFGIPVKFWELLVIWLERTLISIPLVALSMYIFF